MADWEYDEQDELTGQDDYVEETAPVRKRRWPKVVLLLIVVLFFVVLFGFKLKTVNIYGNSWVSTEEVKDILNYDKYGKNTLLFWLMNLHVDTSGNSMISRIKVTIHDPETVDVTVYEENLALCLSYGDQFVVINEDGLVLACQDTQPEGVPYVTSVKVTKAEPGKQIEIDENSQQVYDGFLDIATQLLRYKVSADSITVDEDNNFTLNIDNVRVQLGPDVLMSEKISELSDLSEELEGLSGVLHLENYDTSQDSIIFTKDE